MAHPALAGAEVALPEPLHPEGATAGPAGGNLSHIVTPCNAKPGLPDQRLLTRRVIGLGFWPRWKRPCPGKIFLRRARRWGVEGAGHDPPGGTGPKDIVWEVDLVRTARFAKSRMCCMAGSRWPWRKQSRGESSLSATNYANRRSAVLCSSQIFMVFTECPKLPEQTLLAGCVAVRRSWSPRKWPCSWRKFFTTSANESLLSWS